MQKGVFLVICLVLVVWFFFSLCFCAFVLYKIAQNGYFHAFLEVFCLLCSHKRPVFNCFFLPILFFCFCLPFQKSIFLCFVHEPLFRKDSLWGFFWFFFCLPFPFLMFACLFETNFPNIPFLKRKLLSFLAVSFFLLLFLFLFSRCMFQPFCFYVGFVFVVLFCFVFLFLSCFLFCFQSMKTRAGVLLSYVG